MEKKYYSISEVAAMLGEQVSLVRYWSNRFPRLVRPRRSARGVRSYSAEDIETLRLLHHLVNHKGLTLDGAAAEIMRERRGLDEEMKVLDTLRGIRERLVEVRKTLTEG